MRKEMHRFLAGIMAVFISFMSMADVTMPVLAANVQENLEVVNQYMSDENEISDGTVSENSESVVSEDEKVDQEDIDQEENNQEDADQVVVTDDEISEKVLDAEVSGVINNNGSSISWSLSTEGHLEVSGEGNFFDEQGYMMSEKTYPWYPYSSSIKSATISLSKCSFMYELLAGCSNLEIIDFSGTDFGYASYNEQKIFPIDGKIKTIKTPINKNKDYIDGNLMESHQHYYDSDGWIIAGFPMSEQSVTLTSEKPIGTDEIDELSFDYGYFKCSINKNGEFKINGCHINSSWEPWNIYALNIKTAYIDLSTDEENYQSLSNLFTGCKYLTKVEFSDKCKTDKLKVYYANNAFEYCSSLETLDLSCIDTSEAVEMSNMFRGCSSLNSLDISSFTSEKVTKIDGMFAGCKSLKSLDLSGFDFSEPRSELYAPVLLDDCPALEVIHTPKNLKEQVYLPYDQKWFNDKGLLVNSLPKNKVESVVYTTTAPENEILAGIFGTFNGEIEWSIDDNGLLTLEGTGLSGQYYNYPWGKYKDKVIKAKVNLSNLYSDSLRSLFEYYYNLEEVDLSGLDTSGVSDYSRMFCGCTSLKEIDISNFDMTSSEIKVEGMFYDCGSLKSIKTPKNLNAFIELPRYEFELVQSKNYHTHIDASWIEENDDSTSRLIEYLPRNKADSEEITKVKTESLVNEKEISGFVDGPKGGVIWTIDESGCLTVSGKGEFSASNRSYSEMTYSSGIKYPWRSLESKIKKAIIDVSDVINVEGIFASCKNLEEADLSKLDTSEVGNMRAMFSGCNSLKSLDVSSFDTSNVIDMAEMFHGCNSLKNIDLSSFDMSNVVSYDYFIYGCNALKEIKTPKNLRYEILLPYISSSMVKWHISGEEESITKLPLYENTSYTIEKQLNIVADITDDIYKIDNKMPLILDMKIEEIDMAYKDNYYLTVNVDDVNYYDKAEIIKQPLYITSGIDKEGFEAYIATAISKSKGNCFFYAQGKVFKYDTGISIGNHKIDAILYDEDGDEILNISKNVEFHDDEVLSEDIYVSDKSYSKVSVHLKGSGKYFHDNSSIKNMYIKKSGSDEKEFVAWNSSSIDGYSDYDYRDMLPIKMVSKIKFYDKGDVGTKGIYDLTNDFGDLKYYEFSINFSLPALTIGKYDLCIVLDNDEELILENCVISDSEPMIATTVLTGTGDAWEEYYTYLPDESMVYSFRKADNLKTDSLSSYGEYIYIKVLGKDVPEDLQITMIEKNGYELKTSIEAVRTIYSNNSIGTIDGVMVNSMVLYKLKKIDWPYYRFNTNILVSYKMSDGTSIGNVNTINLYNRMMIYRAKYDEKTNEVITANKLEPSFIREDGTVTLYIEGFHNKRQEKPNIIAELNGKVENGTLIAKPMSGGKEFNLGQYVKDNRQTGSGKVMLSMYYLLEENGSSEYYYAESVLVPYWNYAEKDIEYDNAYLSVDPTVILSKNNYNYFDLYKDSESLNTTYHDVIGEGDYNVKLILSMNRYISETESGNRYSYQYVNELISSSAMTGTMTSDNIYDYSANLNVKDKLAVGNYYMIVISDGDKVVRTYKNVQVFDRTDETKVYVEPNARLDGDKIYLNISVNDDKEHTFKPHFDDIGGILHKNGDCNEVTYKGIPGEIVTLEFTLDNKAFVDGYYEMTMQVDGVRGMLYDGGRASHNWIYMGVYSAGVKLDRFKVKDKKRISSVLIRGNSFPVTVDICDERDIEPVKTLTITEDMVVPVETNSLRDYEYVYYFTQQDITGLTTGIPYFVIATNSIGKFDCTNGYLTDFKSLIDLDQQSATTAGTLYVIASPGENLDDVVIPKKTGYVFKGYFEYKNGKGIQYYDETGKSIIKWNSNVSVRATKLYAYWVPEDIKTYTITYHMNGGINNTANPSSYTSDMTAKIALKDPLYEGYVFEGWYSDEALTTKITEIDPTSLKNIDVYAKWTKVAEEQKVTIYTITYHMNGGTNNASNPATYKDGDSLIKLAEPNYNGYTFEGWYSDEALTIKITEIDPALKKNVDVYAKWKKNVVDEQVYTITYHLNGGTNSDTNPLSFKEKDAVIKLDAPTYKGFKFAGWFTDSRYTTEIKEINPSVKHDVHVYAKWKPYTYTVKFDANGGTGSMEAQTYDYGVDELLPACNFKFEGKYFEGWALVATEDIKAVSYSDGAIVNNIIENKDDDKQSVTLYAVWSSEISSVNYYNIEGATIVNGEFKDTYKPGTDVFKFPVLKKNGYVFDGWYTDIDFETKISGVSRKTTGRVDVYAKWSPFTYTIKFVANGGTGSMLSQSYDYDEKVEIGQCMFTKKGCEFKGWSLTKQNLDGAVLDIIDIETLGLLSKNENKQSVKLYAVWTPNEYDIDYVTYVDSCTGLTADDNTYTFGKGKSSLPNLHANGYEFVGWYKDEAFKKRATSVSEKSAEDITLYARWKKTYTIVFDGNGGSGTMREQKMNYSTAKALIANKFTSPDSNSGFAGWAISKENADKKIVTFVEGQIISNFDESILSSDKLTLYAVWDQKYTISYELNGGSLVGDAPTEYKLGESITTLPKAEKEGYDFAGWYFDKKLKKPVSSISSSDTGCKILYAKYTAKTYTLKFSAGENSSLIKGVMKDQSVNVGSAKSVSKCKFKAKGLVIDGWDADEDGKVDIGNADKLSGLGLYGFSENGIVKLTAIWKAAPYKITYYTYNGQKEQGTYFTNEDTLLMYPERMGYVFDGWCYDKGLTKKISNDVLKAGSTGNIKLYASWKKAE